MKKWMRRTPGKTAVFISVILLLCVTAGCAMAAVFMAASDFYEKPEKVLIRDFLERRVEQDALLLTQEALYAEDDGKTFETPADASNLRYQLYRKSAWIARTEGEERKNISMCEYLFFFGARQEEGGSWSICSLGKEMDKEDRQFCEQEGYEIYSFYARMEDGLPIQDGYAMLAFWLHVAYTLQYAVYPIGILTFLAAVCGIVMLLCAAGRRPDTEELFPGPLYRVPFDLLLFMAVGIMVGLHAFSASLLPYNGVLAVVCLALGGIETLCLVLGLCMSIAVRIKGKTLLKNTVIVYLLKGIRFVLREMSSWVVRAVHGMPTFPKVMISFLVLTVLEALVIAWAPKANLTVFWTIEKLILLPLVLYIAQMMRTLKKGGDALAKGESGFQVDTRLMWGDFKEHGDNLNSLAAGMNRAVEEKMKSERMKTELITNVSHDIKTPLTSIINYADLIGKEPCENPVIVEYVSVLTRQAGRLKRLIEDLVEASKAATGNLEVALAPCEAEIFLTQTAGEYEQKVQQAGLTLITQTPEKPCKVLADGRRMQRVFDNLMNNICKYAQPGTRVYLSLEEQGGQVVFTFKNTSRVALNLSAQELMERFVRGDVSRHTEGNGLGLSIAKSLTELQGGTFTLSIDGDLFKVTLRFPRFYEVERPSARL
ncbi:MAG: sensor histidine kinase [Candidatus Heritagella sp.]